MQTFLESNLPCSIHPRAKNSTIAIDFNPENTKALLWQDPIVLKQFEDSLDPSARDPATFNSYFVPTAMPSAENGQSDEVEGYFLQHWDPTPEGTAPTSISDSSAHRFEGRATHTKLCTKDLEPGFHVYDIESCDGEPTGWRRQAAWPLQAAHGPKGLKIYTWCNHLAMHVRSEASVPGETVSTDGGSETQPEHGLQSANGLSEHLDHSGWPDFDPGFDFARALQDLEEAYQSNGSYLNSP